MGREIVTRLAFGNESAKLDILDCHLLYAQLLPHDFTKIPGIKTSGLLSIENPGRLYLVKFLFKALTHTDESYLGRVGYK